MPRKYAPLWDVTVVVIALSHAHSVYIAYIRVTSARGTGKGGGEENEKKIQFFRVCQGFQTEQCLIPR